MNELLNKYKVDILVSSNFIKKTKIEDLSVEDNYIIKKLIKSLYINTSFKKGLKLTKYQKRYSLAHRSEISNYRVEKYLKKIYDRNIDINILCNYYLNFWLKNNFLTCQDYNIHKLLYYVNDDYHLVLKSSPHCNCDFKELADYDECYSEKNIGIMYELHYYEHEKYYYKFYKSEYNETLYGLIFYSLNYKNIKLLIKYGLEVNNFILDRNTFSRPYNDYNNVLSSFIIYNHLNVEKYMINKNKYDLQQLYYSYKIKNRVEIKSKNNKLLLEYIRNEIKKYVVNYFPDIDEEPFQEFIDLRKQFPNTTFYFKNNNY